MEFQIEPILRTILAGMIAGVGWMAGSSIKMGIQAIVSYCKSIAENVSTATKSIGELNTKMAVVVEKIENHDEKFDQHGKRIERLEGLVIKN